MCIPACEQTDLKQSILNVLSLKLKLIAAPNLWNSSFDYDELKKTAHFK